MKTAVKQFLATGGIAASLLLVNPGVSAAQYIPDISANDPTTTISPRPAHKDHFGDKLAVLAAKADIDPEELSAAHGNRTTIKQLLKQKGLTESDIQQLLGNKRTRTISH